MPFPSHDIVDFWDGNSSTPCCCYVRQKVDTLLLTATFVILLHEPMKQTTDTHCASEKHRSDVTLLCE